MTSDSNKSRLIIVHQGEDGYWIAECPSLPGCNTQGRAREEAITNIKEAIELFIEVLKEDNLPIPVCQL